MPDTSPDSRRDALRPGAPGKVLAKGGVAACAVALATVASGCGGRSPSQAPDVQATIRVDASSRTHPLSELLYGQFAEFMFENIKQGMWAELLVNRGFEDLAPPPAAAHYWERYPDTRNHANGFALGGVRMGLSEQGYPPTFENRAQVLVNTLPEQQGHGIYQANIPLRGGVTYRGSVWLRATGVKRSGTRVDPQGPFEGSLTV